ncbi:histidinol-phosphate aminotransferase family protein [Desulfobotulus sp. H1]|uniref:Histidinol-phosphate aminotransferase family protein n=1 Tax=Desulfobotulus pelophilus TaxID=2823377 RepID=A0ABT3N7J3_9BACT|nr:histidinol-phosphate transaminase [Desulfobotulus pelophilus]MCW7753002.1 histidinol-phosphate aminotransferase family protein [Desulfobotulus pelophilus]
MNKEARLSRLTRMALGRESSDYLSRDVDELTMVEELKNKYGLENVYRFDVGKNIDGFSPLIQDVLETPELLGLITGSLTEYPENSYQRLRRQLSLHHDIPPEWFVFGAGLESVIDHIARAVLDPGDHVLIPVPNFDVFQSVSFRMGASLTFMEMPGLCWDGNILESLCRKMKEKTYRLVWLSNPVNPTGQFIPQDDIHRLLSHASETRTLVVVDEAYGEYTDRPHAVRSASSLLKSYPNLMVLRTFSKVHCLPSARVGYMAASSERLRQATNTYRPMFPFSWFSLYMAQLAVLDGDYVNEIRRRNQERKKCFFNRIRQQDSGLETFMFLESDTNTLMFRHRDLGADALHGLLAERGFLTANLNRLTGIQNQGFLRMTLHGDAVNEKFLDACRWCGRHLFR